MPRAVILRESSVIRTPRVAQAEGIFDLQPSEMSRESWTVDFELPDEWNVGLIVGPSGSGKSTVARELFGDQLVSGWPWPQDKSVLDGFPAEMGTRAITELLSSVGFSSPPLWLRPFHVLSNGEQFRVSMARTLAEMPSLAVVDEFTSVIDRTVAQIGSAAIQKTVRRRGQRFIAVTCHYDVADWLEPDWVYQPLTGEFVAGRSLRRRPPLHITVRRVHHSAWQLFKKYHYLDASLNVSARCFVAFLSAETGEIPVAFTSVLPTPHRVKNLVRGHRTVCLPDYQGVGIGNALSNLIASAYTAAGKRFLSATASPSMTQSRNASPHWKMTRAPGMLSARSAKSQRDFWKPCTNRLTSTWEYVGPRMDQDEAKALIYG